MLPLALSIIGHGQDTQRPNIVFILADDLGYREIGSFGQAKIPTPNIDRLGREGASMAYFYSNSPVCAPTRASLLTGKHQGRAAIRGNKEVGGWTLNSGEGQMPLPSSEKTIAESLKDVGYTTAAIGKWGLGGPATEGRPTAQGFDFFFGYLCQRQAHNYYPTYLWRKDQVFLLEKNRYFDVHPKNVGAIADFSPWRGEQYAPDIMDDQMMEWLKGVGKKPFFLFVPSPLPHGSLQAPDRLINKFPRQWDTEPYLATQGYTPAERPRATYAAMITKLDETVGKILDHLDRTGQAENTIVIFSSDNGTAPNGGVDRKFFDSLGELRGYKTNLWEGGVRVPTLIRWPGRIRPGTVYTGVGQHSDWFPTLMSWARGKSPSTVTGVSLASAILENKPLSRKSLYFEFCENPSQSVVLDGRWKAIRPHLKQNLNTQLFDLREDPSETKDLAATHPEMVRRAEAVFKQEHVPNKDFPLPGIDN